jgi:hypothetical protein
MYKCHTEEVKKSGRNTEKEYTKERKYKEEYGILEKT